MHSKQNNILIDQFNPDLTLAQAKVTYLFLCGLTTKEIAFELNKSYRTAEDHIKFVKIKLQAKTHIGLALEAIRRRYINCPLTFTEQDKQYCLTLREAEVLHLLLSDLQPSQIAENMSISIRTVEGYINNIRIKWRLKEPIDIVMTSIKRGYIIIEHQKNFSFIVNIFPFINSTPKANFYLSNPVNFKKIIDTSSFQTDVLLNKVSWVS